MNAKELVECIEEHLNDELSFQIGITEYNQERLGIFLKDDKDELIMLELEENLNMYDSLLKTIREHFQGNIKMIKVHAVFEGDYLYLIIHHKVCICIKYIFENGKKWLTQICQEC